MKRVWLGLAVLLALGLGLGRDGAAAPKGTLTIGIPTDINTLDPHMGPEVNSLNVCLLDDGGALLRLDAQGNIKPQLAESWRSSTARRTSSVSGRTSSSHNGEPFTGKAVEYSWKRSQEKHRANKTKWAAVSRIDHLDDQHHPDRHRQARRAIFLKKMASATAAIFPAQGDGGGWRTRRPQLKPIGTGPVHPLVLGEGRARHLARLNPNHYPPGRAARWRRSCGAPFPRRRRWSPRSRRARSTSRPDPAQPGAGARAGSEPPRSRLRQRRGPTTSPSTT